MADAKDQAKGKVEEVRNWAEKTVGAVSVQAGDVSDSVRDHAKQVFNKAQEAYDEVAGRSQELIDHADAAVRENPHLSVGAALGAGLFVGMLVGLAVGSGKA